MNKRKEYTPEHKAKPVIKALREEMTMSEIASREDVSLNLLGNWKAEFLKYVGRVFSRNKDEKAAAREVDELRARERDYQARVGQLMLEVDFLEDAHEKLFGSRR